MFSVFARWQVFSLLVRGTIRYLNAKLLMETVEQIRIPLATAFNLSLKEGVVPFEWKKANIIPIFKNGSRNKSDNYRPVSLTSVICKLLERLNKTIWWNSL